MDAEGYNIIRPFFKRAYKKDKKWLFQWKINFISLMNTTAYYHSWLWYFVKMLLLVCFFGKRKINFTLKNTNIRYIVVMSFARHVISKVLYAYVPSTGIRCTRYLKIKGFPIKHTSTIIKYWKHMFQPPYGLIKLQIIELTICKICS